MVAALTDGGTYEDPTTGGPLSGDALTASVAGVLRRVPRRALRDRSPSTTTGETTACAQWRMLGTNTGPLPGGPATGAPLDLPGADFFTYDAERRQGELAWSATSTPRPCSASSGCRPTSRPPTSTACCSSASAAGSRPAGPRSRVRSPSPGSTSTPSTRCPSSTTVTGIIMEQHGNEHYLGTCFATVGRRNYTFTAWTSPDAAQEALRGDGALDAR